MSDRSVRVTLAALVAPYIGPITQATAATRGLQTSLVSAQTTAKTGQGAMMAMGKGSMLAMGGAGLAAYALVKGLASVTKAAIDFESSFAGIRKTVDATEEEFQVLEDGMRRLATEIPVSVNELNRIGELGGQLGIAKENLVDFTAVIAKLGVTTNLTVEDAALKFAQFAAVTGLPEAQFSNLASAVVGLGNNFETTEAEIVDYASRLAGAGEIAGLTEADILGIGTAAASIGVQAEAGGTAIQKVLLKINESVTLSDDKLETFAETAGMTAGQFSKAWERNAGQTFTKFVEGLGASGDDAQIILKELGLTDQRLTRAFLGLAGAGDKVTDAITLSNAAFDENNALQEEAAKRFETTEMRVQLAKNQIEDLKISWGEWSSQSLGDSAQALTDVMQVQNRFNDSLSSTVNLLTQLGDGYTNGTTSASEFIQAVEGNIEGLDPSSNITELRENLEALVSDIESDTLFERLGNFGRAEAGELKFEQAESVLELVRAMEAGVPILEDGENALGLTGDAAEEAGDKTAEAGEKAKDAVSGFDRLFDTAKDFRKWRESAGDALSDLSGEFSDLAGEANVTADEIVAAFRKQIEATANFRSNLDVLITRGAKPALIQDLIDMGDEGVRWAAALAEGSDEAFDSFVRLRGAADREMDGVTAAVRRAAGQVTRDAGRMKGSIDALTRSIEGVPRVISIRITKQTETTGSGKLAPGQADDLTADDGDPVLQSFSTTTTAATPARLEGGYGVIDNSNVTHLHLHGDVYGYDDFIGKVERGLRDRAIRMGA